MPNRQIDMSLNMLGHRASYRKEMLVPILSMLLISRSMLQAYIIMFKNFLQPLNNSSFLQQKVAY